MNNMHCSMRHSIAIAVKMMPAKLRDEFDNMIGKESKALIAAKVFKVPRDLEYFDRYVHSIRMLWTHSRLHHYGVSLSAHCASTIWHPYLLPAAGLFFCCLDSMWIFSRLVEGTNLSKHMSNKPETSPATEEWRLRIASEVLNVSPNPTFATGLFAPDILTLP